MKRTKPVLARGGAIFLVLALILSMMTVPSLAEEKGDFTKLTEPKKDSNGAYLVGTPEELAWINTEASTYPNAANMVDFDVILTDDINMEGYTWIPIGLKESSPGYIQSPSGERTIYTGGSYTGTFDGNGHVIKNLTIDRVNVYTSGGRFDVVGLIGFLRGGEIKNLGVEGSIRLVDNVYSTMGEWLHVGGIAGFASNAKITNCYTNMTINVGLERNADGTPVHAQAANNCDSYVGGLVGSITLGTKVSNCYSTGSITADAGRTLSMGGLVGATRHNSYSSDKLNAIENCWSSAAITAKTANNPSYLGGIAGNVGATSSSSIPEVSCSFALNTSITGDDGNDWAGRVIGNSELFDQSGHYNYGLVDMTLTNVKQAEIDDARPYSTGAGRDITADNAKKATTYTNVGWEDGIWFFSGTDYPRLDWEPDNSGKTIASPIEIIPSTVTATAPTEGWKEGQNTFTVSSENACTVLLTSQDGTVRQLNAKVTNGTVRYTATLRETSRIQIYVTGDVNGDGNLGVNDVMLLADIVTSGDAGTVRSEVIDINRDGTINVLDVLELLSAANGKTKIDW